VYDRSSEANIVLVSRAEEKNKSFVTRLRKTANLYFDSNLTITVGKLGDISVSSYLAVWIFNFGRDI